MTTLDGILFVKSPVKNKKYRAIFDNGEFTDFGDDRYQQYYDRIGLYSHLDHLDDKRRLSYIKRHLGLKNKDGSYSVSHTRSPAYLSLKYLW
jgi:hypothetical protein